MITRSKTITTETFEWNKKSLREVLARAVGLIPEEVIIDIYEEDDRTGGLGGGYVTPARVVLTRTITS